VQAIPMKRRKKVDETYLRNLEYLLFLDGLRETGTVNMFDAAPVLQEVYNLDKKTAQKTLKYWIDTFADRHQI